MAVLTAQDFLEQGAILHCPVFDQTLHTWAFTWYFGAIVVTGIF